MASRIKLFVLWSDEVIFTYKTRNIASPEETGVTGIDDELGLGGAGTDPVATGGLGVPSTDSQSGGAGGVGVLSTDPSLQTGCGIPPS